MGKQIVSSIYAFCPLHTPGVGGADGDFFFAADRYRSRFFFLFAKDHGWLYWTTGMAVGKSIRDSGH